MDIYDVPIKVHYPWCVPYKADKGDWIDLSTAEDVQINEYMQYLKISLGVSMKLPDGYEAILAARSSTFQKYGIIMAGGIGVIDNSYCGDNDIWQFPAIFIRPGLATDIEGKNYWNLETGDIALELNPKITIEKGTRIAQFKIQKQQPKINFIFVDNLLGENRGGFGTTG